jgi:hypothetical protein
MCQVHRNTDDNCDYCRKLVRGFGDDYNDYFANPQTGYVLIRSMTTRKMFSDGAMEDIQIILSLHFVDKYSEVAAIISRNLQHNYRLYELIGRFGYASIIGYLRVQPNLWDLHRVEPWEDLCANSYKVE